MIDGWSSNAVWGIISIVPHCINIVLFYISFSKITNKYPLNDCLEYVFEPKSSQLGHIEEGKYVIKIYETKNGLWETKDDNEKMLFNMNGYPFPEQYIATYFIRNIHFYVINRNKYPIIKLFSSLNLKPLKKYQEVELLFTNKNDKTHSFIIVMGNRTRLTVIMKWIIRSKYYSEFISKYGVAKMRKRYVYINEELYKNGRT
jgi:hypothetical protein